MPEDIVWTGTFVDDISPGLDAIAAALAGVDASMAALAGTLDGIDGSFAALSASADAVASSLDGIDAASGAVSSTLAGIDSEAAASAASIDALSASSDTVAASLGGIAAAADAAIPSVADLDAQFAAMQAEIAQIGAEADAALPSLLAQAEAMKADAIAASESSMTFKQLQEAQKAAFDSQSAMMGGIQQIGAELGKLLLIVGAVSAVIGVVAVKAAGDFQAGLTRLYTTAGESLSNLKADGDGILAMSVQVGIGAQKLLDAMYWVSSAGFYGAKGLAVLKIAAEGAKAENADLIPVAHALTGVLVTFASTGISAAQAMNVLIGSVGQGATTLADLSGAISNVLPAASKFHLNLIDITTAIATMTDQNDNAASAATHLRQVILALESPAKAGAKALADIGITSQQLSTAMKTSLPGAIQMIIDDLGKRFPEGSAAYNNALKAIAGGNKQLMGLLELSGTSLAKWKAAVAAVTGDVKAGGNSVMGWSDVQRNFNFVVSQAGAACEALMIVLGQKLLPVIGQLLSGIAPLLQRFTAWISNANAVKATMAAWAPVLTAAAIIVGGILVTAFVAWAGAAASAAAMTIAATWPILAIIAAIAALAAGLIYAYQHWTAFRNVVDSVTSNLRSVVGGAFAYMQQQAEQHTLQMKLQAVAHTQAMAESQIAILMRERAQVGQQILEAKNAVVKHMLEMKLASITQALQMQEGVVHHAEQMRIQVNAQLALLPSAANVHLLQLKVIATAHTTAMANEALRNLLRMKLGIEQQMAAAKTAAEKHALAMKLAVVNHSIQMEEGTVKSATAMHTRVVAQVQRMQATLAAQKANPLLILAGGFNAVIDAAKRVGAFMASFFMPIFQNIGAFMKSTFMPVWAQLVDLFNNQIKPAWNQIVEAVKPLVPVLQDVALFVGGVLVVAFGLLVGILKGVLMGIVGFVKGLVTGIAGVIGGLATILGGIVHIITGVIQIISGIIRVFVDLFTGNFKALGADFQSIGSGIVNMCSGFSQILVGIMQTMWAAISGIFNAAMGLMSGLISGFVTGIVDFFKWLWHQLVGGSIIPDMINGIFTWFGTLISQGLTLIGRFVMNIVTAVIGLKTQVVNWIHDLVAKIAAFFLGLATGAVQWGLNFINGFLNGLKSAWQNVVSWIQGVLGWIAGLFPHSPVEHGPLQGLEAWGENIANQIADGMTRQLGQVRTASTALALAISQPIQQQFSVSTSNQLTNALLTQIKALLQEQTDIARTQVGSPPTSNTLGSVRQNVYHNTFQRGGDINSLFGQVNRLSGQSVEYGERGAWNGGGIA